jgi:hypothetical protein
MDSPAFLAFKIARALAYIAIVPGLWMTWQGFQGQYRKLLRVLLLGFALLVLVCVIAMISSGGTHADAWDVTGVFYWSTNAAAIMVVCAVMGFLTGKIKRRSNTNDPTE